MEHTTGVWKLAVAELAVFVILLPVVIYVLVRHGKHGINGWGFLAVFCLLRLTSSGIQTGSKDGTSTTGAIVNSIGISSLLLAFAGVTHEVARAYDYCDRKLGYILSLFFHLMVVSGIVLAAIGGSNLAKPKSLDNDYTKDHSLQKAGYAVLLLAILLVMACTIILVLRLRNRRTQREAPGLRLLFFNLAAQLFGIVRVIYGLAAAISSSRDLSSVTGTFAVKLVLIFLIQLIATLLLIMGGLVSRHMPREDWSRRGETNDGPIKLQSRDR